MTLLISTAGDPPRTGLEPTGKFVEIHRHADTHPLNNSGELSPVGVANKRKRTLPFINTGTPPYSTGLGAIGIKNQLVVQIATNSFT
jgi:hypothetical protein